MSDKKHYVYSTLSSPVNYQIYEAGGGDVPVPTQSILIMGGANIPDKYMRTPLGVVTPVTDQELDALQSDQTFQLHVKNGYIVVKDKQVDPEKVAADMEGRDQSAPLVDQDFVTPPVSTAADEDDKPAPKSSGNGRRA